jgi:predicted ribosome quality control (RQC) complex YloA/Tae2 family protein
MHFHHYALKALSHRINSHWSGAELWECFSQNKQELVLETSKGFLRIGCQTPLTYVATWKEFTKAKKNVVDLFPELIGLSLQSSDVLDYERVMMLNFSQNTQLILKLHGMMANIMLRREGEIVRIFRQDRAEDWDYVPATGPYNTEAAQIEPESDSMRAIKQHLAAISPIYDAHFAHNIVADMKAGKSFKDAFAHWTGQAQNEDYWIVRGEKKVEMLLFNPLGNDAPQQQVKAIERALGAFLSAHYQYKGYWDLYRKVDREIRKPVEKYRKVYASYQENIDQLTESRNPEEIGHLLMANLHAIPSGLKVVELDDFYTNALTKVKLKPELSPQENAARYYDKHKNRKAKLSYLQDQLEDIEGKLFAAEEDMEALEKVPAPTELPFDPQKGFAAKTLREHKKILRSLLREQTSEEEKKLPFRSFRHHNYDIFVGRSGPNNDLLTFKFASKEDIWLHAKDVPGSHVIIRNKPGHPPPLEVLEYAASLAAYYSKLRNETLAPVSYTPRKYVRKRKGDPPGMVAVDREEVMMIEPLK